MLFRRDDIRSRQSNPARTTAVRCQHFETLLHESGEPAEIRGRSVGHRIAVGEPKGRDLRTVDPFPEKLGRRVRIRHAALGPEGLVAPQLHQLRHLRVVPERVELPTDSHVHAQASRGSIPCRTALCRTNDSPPGIFTSGITSVPPTIANRPSLTNWRKAASSSGCRSRNGWM